MGATDSKHVFPRVGLCTGRSALQKVAVGAEGRMRRSDCS